MTTDPTTQESNLESNTSQAAMSVSWSRILLYICFVIAAIAYAALTASQISRAYVDFGDGNYLYIGWRMADGLVPYRDIMAPQPPLHLLLASWTLQIGAKINAELVLIRWLSILLRIGIALTIVSIVRKASRSLLAAVLAGAIFLFMPLGVIWSLGYQSEPLEILFLALMVRCVMSLRGWSLALAAVFGTLACFTNMTALPYALVTMLWLIWRLGWISLSYLLPYLALMTAGVIGMEAWSEGHYLQNVFFNQVGTYPPGVQLVRYVAGKLYGEGADVVAQEGLVIALSLIGMGICIRRETANALEFLSLFAMFSLGSIVFVSKGGTMDYIFTIGEPYVAIFTGYLFAALFEHDKKVHGDGNSGYSANTILSYMSFACALGIMIWRIGLLWLNHRGGAGNLVLPQLIVEPLLLLVFVIAVNRTIYRSLKILAVAGVLGVFAWHSALLLKIHVVEGATYQLPPERTEQIANLIRKHSPPRAEIISPPWFAYDSGRTLAGEYSETFIWTVGYFNERVPGQRANVFDGPFTEKALQIASLLQERKIPLVLLDDEQTGRIPEIKEALYGNASYPYIEHADLIDPNGLKQRLLDPSASAGAKRVVELLGKDFVQRIGNGVSTDLLLQQINQRIIDAHRQTQAFPARYKSNYYTTDIVGTWTLSARAEKMLSMELSLEDVRRLNRRILAEAGLVNLRPKDAKYQELTEIAFETRDTPMRFFIPMGESSATEPPALTLDDLIPIHKETANSP